MSSELHKYIETAIEKKENSLRAEVIYFPNDKKIGDHQNLEEQKSKFWSINDKSNVDQLRAVVGVCFMFSVLIIIGLYSNLI